MREQITITRDSDPLLRWEWVFWYFDDRHALVLDSYVEKSRPSKRHGFKVAECYNRLQMRHSTIQESDVVFPADVKAEAAKVFCESLRVAKWKDVGGR